MERALKLCGIILNTGGKEHRSILDIGCREGFSTTTLESTLDNATVVGIDIVPEFVERARLVCDDVRVMDAHKLEFEDRSFDYIFSSHTLEHCYNTELAASEMRRVAKRGIYLVVPLETAAHTDANHSHYFSTVDPLVWANFLNDTYWFVSGIEMTEHVDLIVTAAPRGSLKLKPPKIEHPIEELT